MNDYETISIISFDIYHIGSMYVLEQLMNWRMSALSMQAAAARLSISAEQLNKCGAISIIYACVWVCVCACHTYWMWH